MKKLEVGIEGQPFAPMASDDEQEISKLFEDKDADLILFGHNHRLHLFDDKSTIYFNPGAVGLNNGAHTVYGIVTINEQGISVERKTDYDEEEFIEGFAENKYQQETLFLKKIEYPQG